MLDVIVVSHRSGPLLRGCVRAALEFSREPVHLVLVDNSPEERVPAAVIDVSPRATVIENETNVGYAVAVNQALAASSGELVLLLNPDITAIRGDFRAVARAFGEDSSLAALSPRLVTPDGSFEPTSRREPRPFDLLSETLDLARRFPGWRRPKRFRMLDQPQDKPSYVDAATGACLFVRRAALEDVGALDESFFLYWEETDWLIRAKRRGWATLYFPEVEAVHVGRRSSDVSDDTLALLLLESQHRYSRKHFGLPDAAALRVVLLAADGLRWARGLRPGGADRRDHMARRIRVHVTGRAPHPR